MNMVYVSFQHEQECKTLCCCGIKFSTGKLQWLAVGNLDEHFWARNCRATDSFTSVSAQGKLVESVLVLLVLFHKEVVQLRYFDTFLKFCSYTIWICHN